MNHLIIPEGYVSALSLYDTQIAIKTVKDFFQQTLASQLNLLRVSSPLFVDPASGLNGFLCLLYGILVSSFRRSLSVNREKILNS